MNEIPKKRTRSNPNPSSSKEIERRTSDEQEERGKQGITRRHDLLALKGGKTFKKRQTWRTPKTSHKRSSKRNLFGEKLPEHEGNEKVEFI
jgi:hypothetical protein